MDQRCEWCGGPVPRRRRWWQSRYCSDAHRQAAYRARQRAGRDGYGNPLRSDRHVTDQADGPAGWPVDMTDPSRHG